MPETIEDDQTPPRLRRRAEKLRKKSCRIRLPETEADARRLLHELEVHQIELEMQNTELRIARDEAEVLLEKYTELYDFAPVGYFTLAPNGTIRLANLTGSVMVGIERSKLIGRSFAACSPRASAPGSRLSQTGVFRMKQSGRVRSLGREPLRPGSSHRSPARAPTDWNAAP
jgi:PAS domain-containing protein